MEIISDRLRTCPGCKIALPYQDYPANNRYGVSSPECRAAFDEILVYESMHYGYPAVHRLIIDAYWAQHPPHSEHQKNLGISKRFIDASVQSITVHLIAIYLAIEKKTNLKNIASLMDQVLTKMNQQGVSFALLEPPAKLGTIRSADVRNALINARDKLSLTDYTNLAWQWAYSAWEAWSHQHDTIRCLYNKYQ